MDKSFIVYVQLRINPEKTFIHKMTFSYVIKALSHKLGLSSQAI